MPATLEQAPVGSVALQGRLHRRVSQGDREPAPPPLRSVGEWGLFAEPRRLAPEAQAVSPALASSDFAADLSGRPVRRKAPLSWRVRNWLRMLAAGEHFVPLVPLAVRAARACRPVPVVGPMIAGSLGAVMVATAELRGVVRRSDGTVEDYGLLGRHLVVTAGKNFLASAFDNTVEPEVMKYHAFGTGTNAAAAGDTALQTECTTAYATDNTRPTGSQAHSSATYTTAGVFTPDAAVANTEWGLMSQASNAGGTLFDRQVYAAVNLNGSGDSLTNTYVLTIG